jgi:hypothetical protein
MNLTIRHEPGAVEMPIVPAAGRIPPGTGTARYERCTALVLASQRGWWVLNPQTFTARATESGKIEVHPPVDYVHGEFGGNVLAIHVPYVITTPPGWSLLVQEPANQHRRGARMFSHIVEADWTYVTTEVMWQIETEAVFAYRAPLAMIIPIRRGELQEFRLREEPWDGDKAAVWERDWSTRRIRDESEETLIRLRAVE